MTDDPRRALADGVRTLIEQVRTLDAPDDVLLDALQAVREAERLLAPHTYAGPYMQSQLRSSVGGPGVLHGRDPGQYFPYSPIVGPLNPLAPPVRMWAEGDRMLGETTLGAPYCGPPSMVHGGVIALVFDELLGTLNVLHGLGAFTGTLTVRYERPTPLERPLDMVAWLDRVEGRKVFTAGELRHEGVVTARAEGVFIRSPLLPGLADDGDGT